MSRVFNNHELFARLLGDRQCGLAHLRAGWLSSESAKFICNVIEHFGRPTAPVCVRTASGNGGKPSCCPHSAMKGIALMANISDFKPKHVDLDAAATTATPPDPFDLSTLRLKPSFLETGVKKLLTTVPARKPSPQDWVRVHPSDEYRADFAAIELKEEREDYLVRPEIVPELTSELVFKTVFTAINRQGVVFLWPVRLPAPDDRKTEWSRSAREAAELAMKQWVRVKANMSLGAYEINVAESVMADPVWPELSYQDLVRIAYRDRIVASIDHPVVRRLRGLS